ncbi:hypothetical protein EVJ58_g6841 [Rhodofomes roseus]|uniref:Uncharacterized protein n=1 Tax=Rhodofomes roseus TaxID=34475 RepID=A0A4Y9Y5J6_9APHY|nr:hypothetical protein EVJ58_g6841 [Rhodofomes roseus]
MVVDDDWHIVGLIGCQWEEAYPSTPASAIAMHAGRDATPGSDQSLVGAAGRLYDVPHSVESTERPWSEYLRSVFLWSNEVRVALILVTATDHNLKSLLDLNDAEVQPYKLCATVTDRPIPASIRSRLDLQTVVITARPTSTLNRHQTRDQYLPRVLSQKPHIILLAGSCQTLALRNYLLYLSTTIQPGVPGGEQLVAAHGFDEILSRRAKDPSKEPSTYQLRLRICDLRPDPKEPPKVLRSANRKLQIPEELQGDRMRGVLQAQVEAAEAKFVGVVLRHGAQQTKI